MLTGYRIKKARENRGAQRHRMQVGLWGKAGWQAGHADGAEGAHGCLVQMLRPAPAEADEQHAQTR